MIINTRVEGGDWEEFGDLDVLTHRVVDATCRSGILDDHADLELGVTFGNDALLCRLNRDYRGMDKPTNVLSFPQKRDFADVPVSLIGDVILARETILREALTGGKVPQDHLAHLIVHGILHLLGYDHETPQESDIMERLERRILEALSVSDPYGDDL